MRQSFAKSNSKLRENKTLTRGENNIRSRCYYLAGHVMQRKNIPIQHDEDDNFNIDDLPDIRLIENNNNTLPYTDGNLPNLLNEEDWPIEYLDDDVEEVVDASLNMNDSFNESITSTQSNHNLTSKITEQSTSLESDNISHSSVATDSFTTTSAITTSTVTFAPAAQQIITGFTSYLSPSCTESPRRPISTESPYVTTLTASTSSMPKSDLNFTYFNSPPSTHNNSQPSTSDLQPAFPQHVPTATSRRRKYSFNFNANNVYSQLCDQSLPSFSRAAPKKRKDCPKEEKKKSLKNQKDELLAAVQCMNTINRSNQNTDPSVAARARLLLSSFNTLNASQKEIASIEILEIFEKFKM